MAFPGATPSYAGFTGSHTLSADNHASQHNAEQADIIALANKLGTGASTPTSGLVLRGNGVGTSSWAQVILTSDVSGVLPVANGGTGSTNLTFPSGPDTLVGRTSTDTLTNKTLTTPTINSPIIVTPTIASFVSAQHDHSNAAGGGQITNSALLTGSGIAYRLDLQTKITSGDVIPNAYTTYLTSVIVTLNKEVEIQFGINVRDGTSGAARTGHVRVQVNSVTISGSDIIWETPISGATANAHMIMTHTPSFGTNTFTLQVEADTAAASLLDQAYLRICQIP